MALSRRTGARFESSVWPGFVDVMTALLLILMFVLSIFMIVQFSLRETVTGQTQELHQQRNKIDDLTSRLSALADVLSLERVKRTEAEGQLGEMRATLDRQTAETDRLNAALAAMAAARADAEGRLSDTENRLAKTETKLTEAVDAREELLAALAASRQELDAATEAARLAASKREAMEALVEDLRNQKETAEKNAATLDAEKARALALLVALEAERDDLTASQRALLAEKEALATAKSDLEARTALLEDEKGALEKDKNTLEAEKSALEANRDELVTERDTLKQNRDQLETERDNLRAAEQAALKRLAAAETKLTAEEEAKLLEAAAAEALRRKLAKSDAELDAMTLALEKARKDAEQTLTLLAAAESARDRLSTELENSTPMDEFDREAALRKMAEAELAKAEAQSAEDARRTALLNQQAKQLSEQLGSLQALLDAAEERDKTQKVQIADLGQRLNAALAQKVGELARFRSEFFGRMRDVLGGRSDIAIVGDRFVFQSEVLFTPGSAAIGAEGKHELAKLGQVLREVSSKMPTDLNWILRVDGHTDKIPISSGQYRNNWELSQARALSVVEYLINEEGVPPQRLAATGFGEFQPIAEGDDPASLARNRRIEFKFTER